MKVLLLLALLGCTTVRAEPPITLSQRRAEVLLRDLAWVDSVTPIVRFNVPYIYFHWREKVEACSGLQRVGWPKFYVAPISPLAPDGRVGFYAPDSQSIVFALGHEGIAWIFQHEILHWLLDPQTPIDPHPPEYFGGEDGPGKCGHLVQPGGE